MIRNRKISIERRKGILNSYVISVLLNGSEGWTISSQMKWSSRRKLRTQYVSNDEVLYKMETKWTLTINNRKREFRFLERIMKNISFENIYTSGFLFLK